jgi:hypothetical protein
MLTRPMKKPHKKYGTIPEPKLASEYSKLPHIREGASERSATRWTWPKRRPKVEDAQ